MVKAQVMVVVNRNSRMSREAVLLFTVLFSAFAAAQITKELPFKVEPKPLVSIMNVRGSITVQPVESNQVIVTSLARSDAMKFSSEQHSNRIELRAESNLRSAEVAEY